MHPVWRLPQEVLLVIILAELLASAEAWDRPPRDLPRPRSAPRPRQRLRPSRGALAGRRPRG